MMRSTTVSLSIALVLGGCCFFPSPADDSDDSADDTTTTTTASSITVESVIFARGIDEQFQPIGGAVTEFRADETTVHARVTIDGRPNQGTITMRWMWRELEVARADVDLGDVNGGLLFSFGQDTFIKGWVTSPQLYIGEGHRLVLMHGERELGSYGFRVVPPEGARPSRFVSAEMFAADPRLGDPGPPARTFTPGQTVYIAGRAALGNRSWLDGMFTVNGQMDNALTQEIIGPMDGGDEIGFVMQALPAGGWPPGQHRAALVLDDREVATFDFTVAAQ